MSPTERPTVREFGYCNVYSELSPQERQQLSYVRRYKREHPRWDATMVLAEQAFAALARRLRERGLPVTVLDAGCGHGNYCVDEHRDLVDRVIGVDADPSATAGNRSVDELHLAPLTTLPLPDQSCTVVTCLWVLEHLAEPGIVLGEFARVLKPGGFLLAVTPNANSALVLLRRVFGLRALVQALNTQLYGRKHSDVFPTHYRANTPRVLERLLRENGFADVEIRRNFDPGYTSFNEATYRLTAWSATLPVVLSAPHLLVTARKAS